MKKFSIVASFVLCMLITLIFSHCNQKENNQATNKDQHDTTVITKNYGGFTTPEKWGEHLVTIGSCNDCHTPKKMTSMGPVNDSSLLLSGHPAHMPPPDVDRKEVERKGLGVTQTETAWTGPWGISYAANLTSDSTGIGNWTEDQFLLCLHKGKWMGLETGRQILPPMPWPSLATLSDDELKAIFAYLKSSKPINNVPPPAAPPLSMGMK